MMSRKGLGKGAVVAGTRHVHVACLQEHETGPGVCKRTGCANGMRAGVCEATGGCAHTGEGRWVCTSAWLGSETVQGPCGAAWAIWLRPARRGKREDRDRARHAVVGAGLRQSRASHTTRARNGRQCASWPVRGLQIIEPIGGPRHEDAWCPGRCGGVGSRGARGRARGGGEARAEDGAGERRKLRDQGRGVHWRARMGRIGSEARGRWGRWDGGVARGGPACAKSVLGWWEVAMASCGVATRRACPAWGRLG